MCPPLRASNEGLLRPRVARAQGAHRAIPPLLAGFFSVLLEVLSDTTENITAHCVGIWLHRTGDPQIGNLAGADCPCHQQKPPDQSRRHPFGTAPAIRFGTALDLAEHSSGRRSHLVFPRHAARTGAGLRTYARRTGSTHCRLRKYVRLRSTRSFD